MSGVPQRHAGRALVERQCLGRDTPCVLSGCRLLSQSRRFAAGPGHWGHADPGGSLSDAL
eukprot:3420579-Alexandrium_andersonii.AAC.1